MNSTFISEHNYEVVAVVLTFPLWTIATLYLLLLLIHYLRATQYYSLYDKCTSRNAHFRYDFHLIIGKHSANYNRIESNIILDLLDNQLISTITVQVPGSTIFNNQQVFVYKHSRPNLRCVVFSIYRKHPIKDVRSIRVAHSCNNPDSRIYVYGLNLFDSTNAENKFFPITSLVKYRGTQWALVTTFDPKPDLNFTKLGVECRDPFKYSNWPTYCELLTLVFYIWGSAFCFGHVISVNKLLDSVPLHCLTITFLSGTSATVLSYIYLRFIKCYVVDSHYESTWWRMVQHSFVALVLILAICFWSLATQQLKEKNTLQWMISTTTCSLSLTLLLILIYLALIYRKRRRDDLARDETDANLARTSSKPNLEMAQDPTSPLLCVWMPFIRSNARAQKVSSSSKTSKSNTKSTGTVRTALQKNPSIAKKKHTPGAETKPVNPQQIAVEETMDQAFGPDTKYIKTKDRNSISQYI